jgi:hypothetical protein
MRQMFSDKQWKRLVQLIGRKTARRWVQILSQRLSNSTLRPQSGRKGRGGFSKHQGQ